MGVDAVFQPDRAGLARRAAEQGKLTLLQEETTRF
jgi:hypothetical protein